MARWIESPERYARPKRLLMAGAIVAGFSVSLVFWLIPSNLPTLTTKIVSAATSITMPWIAVVGIRWAGGAVGARIHWSEATRLAAFITAAGVVFTPITLALILATGSQFTPMPLATAVGVFYGTYGLRFLKLRASRALLGSAFALLLKMLLTAFMGGGLAAALTVAGIWVPELRVSELRSAHVAADAGALP
jgi:hypothetical protein